MASISERKHENGNVISYRIRVSRGYDGQGNKLKPYEMTYKPEKGMTKRQIEKELQRQVTLFEEECRTGMISTNKNIKLSAFCDIYKDIKKTFSLHVPMSITALPLNRSLYLYLVI